MFRFKFVTPDSGDQTPLLRFLIFTLSISAWTITVLLTQTRVSYIYFLVGLGVFYLTLLMDVFPKFSLSIIQLLCVLSTIGVALLSLGEIGSCYEGCSDYDISIGTPVLLIGTESALVFIGIYTIYSISIMILSFMAIFKRE